MADSAFRDELRNLINRYSLENPSDTPDFILAEYLVACLDAFDTATKARVEWFAAPTPAPGGGVIHVLGRRKEEL